MDLDHVELADLRDSPSSNPPEGEGKDLASENKQSSFSNPHEGEGKVMTLDRKLIDEGPQILQSKKPVSQMKHHLCSFTLYVHDPCRQIEVHH
ncbi:hypothetical protein Cni_G14058 [Canna indica]|uniref:Uncharacterized protein n=1 Tax=Canna indica TaxID=4628 RepID=A0AAQ3KDA5_9LILI|nr:hypothetical protein Cni_G14058 [Canna indica]